MEIALLWLLQKPPNCRLSQGNIKSTLSPTLVYSKVFTFAYHLLRIKCLNKSSPQKSRGLIHRDFIFTVLAKTK